VDDNWPIGAYVMVRVKSDKTLVGGTVIDKMPRRYGGAAKRVRLQTGEHAGEVLMPGDYDIMEFID
jgi:hypothetical protein